MSRLADTLMGMDRRASRPQGIGGIPRLMASGDVRRRWRSSVFFAIVVAIVGGLGMIVMLQVRSVAPVPAVPATIQTPAPIATRPAISLDSVDREFTMLGSEGLRAAQEGSLPEAAASLRRALELKPRDPDTWNNLGVVVVRQGAIAEGGDAFARAVRFDPNHAEAHRNLAVVLDRQGRTQDAAVHYRMFLRLSAESHPARDDVRRRLAEVSRSDVSTGGAQ